MLVSQTLPNKADSLSIDGSPLQTQPSDANSIVETQ